MKKIALIGIGLCFILSACQAGKGDVNSSTKPQKNQEHQVTIKDHVVAPDTKKETPKTEKNNETSQQKSAQPAQSVPSVGWTGTWHYENQNTLGTLQITNQTANGFTFHLSAEDNGNVGSLDGNAIVEGDQATFSENTYGCALMMKNQNGVIHIMTNDACQNFGGMGVTFNGDYPKSTSVPVQNPVSASWTGKWKSDTGMLTITNETPQQFDFTLDVSSGGGNVGELKGTTQIQGNQAVYSEKSYGCTLSMTLNNGTIHATASDACQNFAGSGVVFTNDYQKQ